jgi:DNA-binding transcriptional MerR regulator
MAGAPDAVKPMACCADCGHFATVHHGGGGGKPGGSSCASPDCECRRFIQGDDARNAFDEDYLRPAEAAQLIEVSVHTLSYWRQSSRGPKPTKVGSRVLYQRKEIERWFATLDGHFSSSERGSKGWSVEARQTTSAWLEKAIEAASRIEPAHTSPWKLASTYALLAIAESLGSVRQSTLESLGTSVRMTSSTSPNSELLTTADVSAMTRISVATLRYWRHAGGVAGPPSVKLGRRVMDRREEVEKWLREAK